MEQTNGLGVHPAVRRTRLARNSEIYERFILGQDTQAGLAREFDVTPPRIAVLVRNEEKRRRLGGLPWGQRLVLGWARAAYMEGLEPIE